MMWIRIAPLVGCGRRHSSALVFVTGSTTAP